MQQPLLERAGAAPANHRNNPSPWKPIFLSKALTGIWTQRNVLHEPCDVVSARFYGGRPDALISGSNVELTNDLCLSRRYGTSAFSTATYPTPPLSAFSLEVQGGIQVVVDTTSAVYYDQQNGSKTLLWTKKTGAGATRFVGVDSILYAGDGVSNWIYTPGNPNGTIWNYGIATPTVAPTVTITEVASAGVSWLANTVFSTMGLILDSNGNVEHLTAVNLNGNTGQVGTTGQGQPNWVNTFGSTTTEGTGTPIIWQSYGAIGQWTAATPYLNQQPIYDPVTNCIFTNFTAGGGTSGSQKPHFNAQPGSYTQDGTVKWGNDGVVGHVGSAFGMNLWQPSNEYDKFDTGGSFPMFIVEPVLPTNLNTGPSSTQAVYLQGATNTGISGTATYTPPWPAGATPAGLLTSDGEAQWTCLGSGTWNAATAYTPWTQGATIFSVVKDTNSPTNFWVCTAITGAGLSGGSITWPSSPTPRYGDQFVDNQVTWTCVGNTMTWARDTQWYLPVSGFAPPLPDQAYGSAGISVSESSGVFSFFIVNSGKSGATVPSFDAEVYNTTIDNAATWICVGDFSQFSLAWTVGHTYAYSYKSLATGDPYLTTGLLTFDALNSQNVLAPLHLNIPGLGAPIGVAPAYSYLGSGTGAISTASPVTSIVGSNAGAVNTISGPYSPDPAVDAIVIWRDADGGGSSFMFEAVEIPNKPNLAGIQNWSFKDFLPDVASTIDGVIFPGLDNLIQAPINSSNNPPPAGFLPMTFAFERIWGSVGSTAFISGGPDVLTGNPNFAYNPADDFPFLATIVRIVNTSQGQITFLNDSIQIIAGGPATSSFYSVPIVPGVGLGNYNALDIFAGEIMFVSSDSQLRVMSPSLNVANPGFAVGDKLAALDASKAYVAYQNNGIDQAIYVGDGSTGYWRLNPLQVPGYASGPEPIWSPFAQVSGGCQMIQSIETAPGIKKLLIGPTGDNASIGMRDLTVFTDQGTQFDSWFTMGAITLASPGQIAILKFLEIDFSGVNFQPQVSYLLDELSGDFTPFTDAAISDPPSLYGPNSHPATWSPNRYYFSGTGSLARCRNIQIKVDFGKTSNQDSTFALCLYGKFIVE